MSSGRALSGGLAARRCAVAAGTAGLLGASGIKPDVNAKLLVTRVKTGSIEFELATLMAFYMYMQQSADGFVIWADFYDRVRRTLLYLSGRGPKPDDYNREDARNFNAFLGTVSGKSGARLSMKRARYIEKTGEKEIIAEFDFNEGDIAEATAKVAHDVLEALPAPTVAPESHKTEIKVPFIWFRTDRDKGKATGQTSDRGIIAPLSDKPLPVYFASEIDSKERMIRIKNNPFDAVFIVDVSVRLDADGNPISYTIMNIHGTAEPKLLAQSED